LDLYCRHGFANVPGRDGQESISAIVFRLSLQ
jgi:hypothetical protein